MQINKEKMTKLYFIIIINIKLYNHLNINISETVDICL